MSLICSKKVVISCDVGDIERFIEDHAEQIGLNLNGRRYEAVAEQEWGNYEQHSFTVEKNTTINEWDRNDLANGKLSWKLWIILNLLADADLIEEGEYLINVSW